MLLSACPAAPPFSQDTCSLLANAGVAAGDQGWVLGDGDAGKGWGGAGGSERVQRPGTPLSMARRHGRDCSGCSCL